MNHPAYLGACLRAANRRSAGHGSRLATFAWWLVAVAVCAAMCCTVGGW